MVLLLDNCEHVVDEAATFAVEAAAAVRGCDDRGDHSRATRRRRRAVWAIPPLTPEESVELLTARAGSAGVGLDTARGITGIGEPLLDRLDGLPLAIELAARGCDR